MKNPNSENIQVAPNSTMAVISLVSGILGLTIFPIVGSIVALVVGYMAQKEIRESNGTIGGDTLATLGLVLGWIGVGLMFLVCCFVISLILFVVPFGVMMEEFGMQFFPVLWFI